MCRGLQGTYVLHGDIGVVSATQLPRSLCTEDTVSEHRNGVVTSCPEGSQLKRLIWLGSVVNYVSQCIYRVCFRPGRHHRDDSTSVHRPVGSKNNDGLKGVFDDYDDAVHVLIRLACR